MKLVATLIPVLFVSSLAMAEEPAATTPPAAPVKKMTLKEAKKACKNLSGKEFKKCKREKMGKI